MRDESGPPVALLALTDYFRQCSVMGTLVMDETPEHHAEAAAIACKLAVMEKDGLYPHHADVAWRSRRVMAAICYAFVVLCMITGSLLMAEHVYIVGAIVNMLALLATSAATTYLVLPLRSSELAEARARSS